MEQIKREKLKLEILTPTYIGGAEDKNLSNKDYYLDVTNNTINIIDTAKLMKYLIENNKYQEFVKKIKSSRKIGDVLDDIAGKENKERVIKEKIKIESVVYKRNQNQMEIKLNNINMFIKNSDNEPYIPASSIKGVITNAIAFDYIKKKPEKFNNYKEKIRFNIRNRGELKKIWSEIQSNIFKEFYEDTSKSMRWTNDLRAYISVSDTVIIEEAKTMIIPKEDFTVNIKSEKINKLPIYREYLVGENIFEFELIINYDKLKKLGINSIEDVLEILQNYTNACIETEERLVKKARGNNIEVFRTSNQNEPNIILGGGAGYYSKTLLTAFFPDNNELRNLVKRTPRTLKLAKYNSKYYVIGMGRIYVSKL